MLLMLGFLFTSLIYSSISEMMMSADSFTLSFTPLPVQVVHVKDIEILL